MNSPLVSHPCSFADGSIQLVIGCMYAGKSSELLRRVRRYEFAKRRCLVIKYAKDTRYSDDCVATHDKTMRQAVTCDTLSPLVPKLDEFDVVGVDEGQFFPDLVDFAEAAANAGKTVIVAALDGTFQRKPFGQVCDLIARAEHVTKLTAVCAVCGVDASFSRRITDQTEVEVIGGSETYIPTCRRCFHAPVGTLGLSFGGDAAAASPLSASPRSEGSLETPEHERKAAARTGPPHVSVTSASVPGSGGLRKPSLALPQRLLAEFDAASL